ncbi:helix-turn-helix transcriptional regulator [Actinomycetes bacterium KLBMP 9797]
MRTLRAQWLGQRLRELREGRGLSLKLVSAHLDRDLSALGRYERAEWPIPRADVVRLLDLYGFHVTAERARLLQVAENLWRTHRWTDHADDRGDAPFIDLPWLAVRAERVCLYHPTTIPEPLRTPRYAALTARYSVTESAHRRQPIPGGVALQAVVDEAALRRPIGGTDTVRAQIRHLHQLHEAGQADVRVLPTDMALHPGLDGPFWLFQMPEPYPPVGYLNGLAGELYIELPQAQRFVDTYRRLLDAALDGAESADLLARLARPGGIDGP